jgi:dihydrofolate reductase
MSLPTVRKVLDGPVRGPWTGHRRGRSPYQVTGCPDLILWGSSTLTSTLLEHGLADEVLLVVYPVLLGTGKRFFAKGTPPRSFDLVSTKAMPSGVILSTYKVAGPLKTV